MTNLVEEIVIKLTLHRDEEPNFPFDDLLGLGSLPRRGKARRGNVTYEWKKLGLVEIPEITGGDN